MPGATMEHEDEFKLPKDTPLPARLFSVTEKSYPYKRDGQDHTFTKWVWEFGIDEGEYAGLHAFGETEPKLTNHPDNKVRHWAETLRGSTFDIGEGLATDDLLDLPCVLLVANEKQEKKGSVGEFYYRCPVIDVLPSDVEIEPPF